MNAFRHKQIIYLISITIAVTVAAQVYSNFQNYLDNKQRFSLDVQGALDLAIETYYTKLAMGEAIVLSQSPFSLDSLFYNEDIAIDTTSNLYLDIQTREAGDMNFKKNDSLTESLKINSFQTLQIIPDSINNVQQTIDLASIDSLEIQLMTKKIFLTLTNSSFDFDSIEYFVKQELKRKNIDIDFALIYKTPEQTLKSKEQDFELSSFSKSTYLLPGHSIEIRFENAALSIIKRGGVDLLISLLIILIIVGSLLYLYKVITEQKQLTEIKNDLISNITHEFKTPITTISTAIEGISSFNHSNDPEKTKKYLGISSDQLKKLNTMVEKLLETALLDSDKIVLSKERIEVVGMTKALLENFDILTEDKKLSFESDFEKFWIDIDIFHMRNAINNLIDNAIKYGGQQIEVSLSKEGKHVVWEVSDNGGEIDKKQQAHIFKKFYRIPKGNVHTVKGFGIGLYYTKTMVEKHDGNINLTVVGGQTKFKIII
mgnify:FL=1